MALFWSRLAVAGASAVVLASCTGPDIAYYASPPGLAPDRAVSLLGSTDPKYFIGSSEYHLVWAVDGKPVKGSAYRWDQPLLITAGERHRLSIAYGWGNVVGGIDVEFAGAPGRTVVIKGENIETATLARLWLEDSATGEILGAKQPVRLGYGNDPTLAIMGPSTTVISINATRAKF